MLRGERSERLPRALFGAGLWAYRQTGLRVPIGEVYALYRERLVTAGNVDVINTLFGGDPGRMCNAVSECVGAIVDPYRRYILMPSCDLPPDTPLHNVKEFLACADRVA